MSFVQIGAGKGRTFHVGVIGVPVAALAMEPCDILEVKNACVPRQSPAFAVLLLHVHWRLHYKLWNSSSFSFY